MYFGFAPDLKSAKDALALGAETVAITYALYVLTQQIPNEKLKTQKADMAEKLEQDLKNKELKPGDSIQKAIANFKNPPGAPAAPAAPAAKQQ